MKQGVMVTGIGVVTPIGIGAKDFASNLFSGQSGIGPIASFDTAKFGSRLGAEIKDFSAADHISRKNLRKMDRLSRLATAASRMAIDDAGLIIDQTNRHRVGIVLGTAFGGTEVAVQFTRVLFRDGPQMANPILVPNTVMNAPAGHTSIELGFTGVNSTVNHYEASAETALAYAAAEIERGRADVMLAGGTEIISAFFFEVLNRFKALSPTNGRTEQARPFDRDRNGPVVGEGAGVVCLESPAHARKRGIEPYCEITGWGLSAASAPANNWPTDPRGPILAMQRATETASIDPGQIDLVSAAANGGVQSDALEAAALVEWFGADRARPLVTSLKGALGESYSSGGIRAAALALSICQNRVPPTLGLTTPIAPIGIVTRLQSASIDYGLLNGFSSGGTFVSVVFKSVE